MQTKYLEMSYECLSAIGNSFELESMMSEIVITFYRETKALYCGYYEDESREIPMVSFGQDEELVYDISRGECILRETQEYF